MEGARHGQKTAQTSASGNKENITFVGYIGPTYVLAYRSYKCAYEPSSIARAIFSTRAHTSHTSLKTNPV
eukprot:7110192-Ditylum_brightwellii.AAC.1